MFNPDNLYTRCFQPVLKKAGLRRFRFHDLRHTFGSLLIQSGASLKYVSEQMGHSSIQLTADIYGHLIPGADISWMDRLDAETKAPAPAIPAKPSKKGLQQSATPRNRPSRRKRKNTCKPLI